MDFLQFETSGFHEQDLGKLNIMFEFAPPKLDLGVCRHARYANAITASGYATGVHRGTHPVIALSVKLGEGGGGRTPMSDVEISDTIPFASSLVFHTWTGRTPTLVHPDRRPASYCKKRLLQSIVFTRDG